MNETDLELLHRYTRHRAEEAFAELVQRHLNLVYCAALRQVHSPQLAEEVTQSAFTDLARNAAKLKPDTILTAWLYQITRRTAIDVIRREARRQMREQIASQMNAMNATDDDWTQVEPLLDDAMAALDDTDRAAVLLRYFENKSLREVGAVLGTSDDAAQKRVSRAVERLREFFAQRGVTVGAGGLGVAISANAVQAAPVGLAATLSSAAFASAPATSGILSLLKLMATTKLKVGVMSTVVVASAVTSLVIQRQSEARIRNADALLRQQAEQLAGIQVEQDRLKNLVALAARPSANNRDELEKLRNQVVTLRQQTSSFAALQEENRQLQATLARARQELRSPNVQPTVHSDEATAKTRCGMQLALAALEYAEDHQAQFPTNLEQAASLFSTEIRSQTNFSPAQFEIVFHGTRTALNKYARPGSIILVRERQPWKNTDGKWVKAYAYSDGSGQVLSVADGDFEAWERRHTIPPDSSKP